MSRILIVEDDATQIDLRTKVLEMAGHHVDAAASPTSAIQKLKKEPSDLVIMDLSYPNAHGKSDAAEGIALIRRIREIGCDTPVVVLSGWPDALYDRPEEHMVSRIVMKPVMTPALLEIVRELTAG